MGFVNHNIYQVNTKWNDLKQKEGRKITYKVPTVTSVQLWSDMVHGRSCEVGERDKHVYVSWKRFLSCVEENTPQRPTLEKLLMWSLVWKDNKISVPKDFALSLALLVFIAL